MKIVVLAPHEDDEIMGAGCALMDWLEQGAELHIAWVTDGRNAYNFTRPRGELQEVPGKTDISEDELAKIRKAEATKVLTTLGVPEKNLHFFELPDQGGSANVKPGVEKLKPLLAGVNILVMPGNKEMHVDHQAAYDIGVQAVKELDLRSIEIYLYKMYGQFINATDKKVKWKMGPYKERITKAMDGYQSQKYNIPTQAQYQAYLTQVTHYLVKIKFEEIGKYPWS